MKLNTIDRLFRCDWRGITEEQYWAERVRQQDLALAHWNRLKRIQKIKNVLLLAFVRAAIKRFICRLRGHRKSAELSHYNCARCNAVIYRDGLRPSWEKSSK